MPISIKISVTVPKRQFKDKGWVQRVEYTMAHKTNPEIQRLFRKTINGWKPINGALPRFTGDIKTTKSSIATIVTVFGSSKASRVYRIVSLGAPKHPISARKGGWLRFRQGYISATVPGSLHSGRSYRVGPWWKAREVDHPGLEARKFDELIAKEYQPTFAKDIQNTLDNVAKTEL